MLDEDAVRLCLLIASELDFMGKEKRNFLTKHIMWLVDDFDAWNAFPWGEYTWEKFYNRTVNVMSNPNVALISSPEEMSQSWFKASAEFIKGLDDQDGTFFQDDQSREKCIEQHNRMCGDTEDGTFDDEVVGKIYPKMNRMSVDDGDSVLDSQSNNRDGVLDSQTKYIIEEAAILPTMSSNSLQAGNAAVSEFFAEFDALKNEVLLIKRRKDDEFDELTKRFSKLETSKTFVKFKKLLTNDLCTENKSSDCNQKNSDGGVSIKEKPNFSSHHNDSLNHIVGVSSEVKVDSYDDNYMSLFNDEEQPAKSSLNDLEVTVEEGPSLGRGLGTFKFKKKNCQRALRPNYVLRSAQIRKKKMAMSLKAPFGQQSDTNLVPTKKDKVYFPVNESKEHWCLAELEIRTRVVTFYDSLGWAGGSRRRW
nr:phospholipase-like protein [Tanacetum cinerariifolium]